MTIEEVRVLLAVVARVPTPNWRKWVFLVITVHAIYCLFDSDQRDRVSTIFIDSEVLSEPVHRSR
jgi:hypothetical protein